MGRIILVTGWFQEYDFKGNAKPGKKIWGVDYGVCEDTGQHICLPPDTPQNLGGKFDTILQEWILE